jgi:hypothetical protein
MIPVAVPIPAGTAVMLVDAFQHRMAAHQWDHGRCLLDNARRLVECRLGQPLGPEAANALSSGLIEALAVLEAGSAAHTSLLMSPFLSRHIPPSVAHVWEAALQSISMIPVGNQSDYTKSFVKEMVNRCAKAAEAEFMEALQLDGDGVDELMAILQPEHRETDARSTLSTSPREALSISSLSEPEDLPGARTASGQSHESPSSTSYHTQSSPDPSQPHQLSGSEDLRMHAQSFNASGPCASSAHAASAHIPTARIPPARSASGCAALDGPAGAPFHASSSLWIHTSTATGSAAILTREAASRPEPPPRESSPREMASPKISLRQVTYEELRELKLIPISKTGPRPKHPVISLANAIAHDRLLGHRRSIRAVAQASTHTVSGTSLNAPSAPPASPSLTTRRPRPSDSHVPLPPSPSQVFGAILCVRARLCCTAGGDRTRAKQYAVLIEQLLMREAGCSPPSYAKVPPSPLGSPPSTPSLPRSPSTLLESMGWAKSMPVVSGVGWAVLVAAGWVPLTCQYVWQSWPAASFGRWPNYVPLVPIGGVALGLSLSPDDEDAIRITARCFVALWLALSASCAFVALHYYDRREAYHPAYSLVWAFWTVLNFGCSLRLVQCIKRFRASSQALCAACWALSRFLCTMAGVGILCLGLTLHFNDPRFVLRNDPYVPCMVVNTAVFLVIGIAATPSWRGHSSELAHVKLTLPHHSHPRAGGQCSEEDGGIS